MNYTTFHGQPFLFINEDAGEFPLPVEQKEVDLTMQYRTVGDVIHCRFFNKDGSEAELCGNALFGFMKENKAPAFYTFQTKAGNVKGKNTGEELKLRMKKADIDVEDFSCGGKHPDLLFKVDIGNHHAVILNRDYYSDYLKYTYKAVHFDPSKGSTEWKPVKFNMHSVIQKDTNTFEVRCFERGVGETQACGSGAYAVGSAMMQHFNLDEVKIIMKGGEYIVKPQTLIVKI